MNFYKRYVGDIQRDTGHLSLSEFGAYDRLLDHYYATESALPSDIDACCRISRAMTKDERKAVISILNQYFNLTNRGYEQKRAEKEITEAQPAMVSARLNGSKGGRPKKPENKTQEKPNGFSNNNPSETQHESSPEPEPYKPNELTHSKEILTSVEPTLAASVCMELKNLNYLDINPSHPKLQAMLIAGATLEEFVHAAQTAKIKKFSYVLGMVEGMRKQAAADNVTQGNFKEAATANAWRKTDAGIMAKAKELKIGTQGMDKFSLIAKIDAKLDQKKAA
jgi:uncharacterized protein YdaU (DUF1376 family)